MSAEKLGWYLKRLRYMPAAERWWRVKEYLRSARDRVIGPPSLEKMWEWRGKEKHSTPHDGIVDVSGVSGVMTRDPNFRDSAFAYGRWIPLQSPDVYHRDPVTQDVAPCLFWRSIPLRGGYTKLEPRRIWEINRFHDILQLSLAARLTGDEQWCREAQRRLSLWTRAHPYPRGIAWASSLEAGIRLVNLWYAVMLASSLRKAEPRKFCELVQQHVQHLERYPSLYSSRGNHTLGECIGRVAGFFLLGGRSLPTSLITDCTVEACRLLDFASEGFEQSLPYLAFTLEMVWALLRMLRFHKQPVPENLVAMSDRTTRSLAEITDIMGYFPLIGDNDDGEIIRPAPVPTPRAAFWTVDLSSKHSGMNRDHRVMTSETVLLKRSLLDPPALNVWQRTGPWEDLSGQEGFRLRVEPGIVVAGKTIQGSYVSIMFTAGPLGAKPMAAHGHGDALQVLLSIDRNPVFIDPGTYLYHSDREFRPYFRSARAHNTFVVNDQDFTQTTGPFIYDRLYNSWIERVETGGRKAVVAAGCHDAYVQHGLGVARRAIYFGNKSPFLRLVDSVSSTGAVSITVFFHVSPSLLPTTETESTVKIRLGERVLRLSFPMARRVEVTMGQRKPVLGWCAPAYSCLDECASIVAEGQVKEGEVFVTEANLS